MTACDHPVVVDLAKAPPADWLLICTKARQTEGASPCFEHFVGLKMRVTVLKNGLDHVERLQSLIGENSFVPQSPYSRRSPRRPEGPVRTGRARSPLTLTDDENGREFAKPFSKSEAVKIELSGDFLSIAWSKLVHSAALRALTRRERGVVADASLRRFIVELMREIMAGGREEGAS